MPPAHRQGVEGFPVTTVARTCFDLMGDPDPASTFGPAGKEIHERNMRRVVNDALADRQLTLGALRRVQAGRAEAWATG